MPIQPQSNPTIPFLRNYTPYQFGKTIAICDLVEDMVSYSLIPNQQTVVDYYVGPVEIPSYTLDVKNLTEETQLKITISYDSSVFLIKQVGNKVSNPVIAIIEPKTQAQFQLEFNGESLNSLSDYQTFESPIKLTVTNVANGNLAIKNINTFQLEQQSLPRLITIQ